MFVLKAKNDCFDAAKDARKNPPALITILLTVIIYFVFAFAMNQVIRYGFKGLSAFITKMTEWGWISGAEYGFYNEMNIYAYTIVFVVLIPLAFLYVKYLEGRRSIRKSFLMDNKAERFPHLLIGFIIGTAAVLLTVGLFKFTGKFTVKLNENVNWICRLIGIIFTALSVYAQEYFFRGFFLSSLCASTKNFFISIIISSLIFALGMHFFYFSAYTFSIWFVLGNFFFGVILSMLAIRFKSLYVSIGAHFAVKFIAQMVLGLPFGRYTYYYSFLSASHSHSQWFNNSVTFNINARLIKSVTDSEIVCIDTGLAFIFTCAIAALILFLLPAKDPNAPDEDEPVMAFSHVTESGSAKVAEKKSEDVDFAEEATAEASDVLKERLAKNEATEKPKKPEPAPAAKDKKPEPVMAEAPKSEPAAEVKPEPKPAVEAKPQSKPVEAPAEEDEPEIKPGMTVNARKSNPFMSAAKTVKRQEYVPKAKTVVNNAPASAPKSAEDEDWDEEEKREHVDSTYLPIDQYLKDKNAK